LSKVETYNLSILWCLKLDSKPVSVSAETGYLRLKVKILLVKHAVLVLLM